MPVLNPDALLDNRVAALREVHERTGLPRAELDLSGGIDSAVMLGLLTLALGPEALTVVYSSIHSGGVTQGRAQALADALGVTLIVHDLTATYDEMVAAMRKNLVAAGWDEATLDARLENEPTVLGSIRSCLRAPLGRGYLRMTGNGLRHGTGNECEDLWLRFYQKGGDGEVDSNPIAILAKGEVFQLAHALGERTGAKAAYRAVIEAAPTPELWGKDVAHDDEDEIGAYLGIESEHSFYSYIDADSAAYARVGLIERVARYADEQPHFFAADEPDLAGLGASAAFAGIDPDLAARMLRAAHRTERITRHKRNPACPSYGTREELLAAGILTNELPA